MLSQAESLQHRLSRAWVRHPLVAFLRHRRQLAFYRQLHAFIHSGGSLQVALTELGRFAPERGLQVALRAVQRDLQRGTGFAEALGRHAHLFDDAHIELLAFAEESGSLDTVLSTLTAHLEATQKVRWQALFIALWPGYLAAGLIFVGPLFDLAAHVNGPVSLGAVYLRGVSHNLLWAFGLLCCLVLWPFALATLRLERQWERLKLTLPAVGASFRNLAASRLVLGLGLGLGAGLEVGKALRLAARATGVGLVQERLRDAHGALSRGESLTEAVAVLGLLDASCLGALSVAERTGTIDSALSALSQELQERSLRAMRTVLLVVTVLFAMAMLTLIVGKMLGMLLGRVKSMYDLAGGKFDGS